MGSEGCLNKYTWQAVSYTHLSKYDFGEVLLKDIVDVLKETLKASSQFLESCIDILRHNSTIQDLLEGEDIVLNSYDCYSDGESVPQSTVLVQTLTILCQIPGLSLSLIHI